MTATIKSYDNHEKFRCVLQIVFNPAYGYQRGVDLLRDQGLSESEVLAIAGPPPPTVDETALIKRAIEYVFDPARAGKYVVGRFNTSNFAALYTARELETAHLERSFHWTPKSQDASFVVFTVNFSGVARDIRPEIARGELSFPEVYGPAQQYAQEAISQGCQAIAAPSKRNPGGSCCAIFSRDSVSAGAVRETGFFT